MTTYADSSALMKRYVDEVDSDDAERLLLADAALVTSWVTVVEVRRNLARLLSGASLRSAYERFTSDLDALAMIVCDETVALAAAEIGELHGVRSLDAIHLASAQRLRIPALPFVTFDHRQAHAARSLGFSVLGV